MLDSKKEQIEKMVGDGKTIVQICGELGLEWKEVSNYLHSVDKTSWRGAKRLITNRLQRLTTESDETVRKTLAEDASKWIDYLYTDGKRLSSQVEKARKAMDNAQKALDG